MKITVSKEGIYFEVIIEADNTVITYTVEGNTLDCELLGRSMLFSGGDLLESMTDMEQ